MVLLSSLPQKDPLKATTEECGKMGETKMPLGTLGSPVKSGALTQTINTSVKALHTSLYKHHGKGGPNILG